MKYEEKKIYLPEGTFLNELLFFEEKDRKVLKQYFQDWVKQCEDTVNLIGGTRTPNLSESLSEAVFSLEMDMPRCVNPISGASSSFDLYDLKQNKRIQLKGASSYAPSSFGPRSEYDELYFFFFRNIADEKKKEPKNRKYSGEFEIYQLNISDIYNQSVNKKETLKDQQRKKLRPRFSIPKKLIDPKSIKPIKTGDINLW
ncbi:Bsp6I family type II restriction endonuclease [Gammaproteobacteria bacterium]|jgi:hypothetical protein|nr:Bsp6I family type II restriction endonuclease [Gammaproteobacteria bacterium]MDC3382026.1 Bsp6I family type II restriction endonuclease [Gammaproteobacteria bacterium]